MREHQIVITLKPEQFLEVQRLSRAAGAKSMGMFVRQKLLAALGMEGAPLVAAKPSVGPNVKRLTSELTRLHSQLREFVAESLAPTYVTELPAPAYAEAQQEPDVPSPGHGLPASGYDLDEYAEPPFEGEPPIAQPPTPPVSSETKIFMESEDKLEQFARRAFAISPRLGPIELPGDRAAEPPGQPGAEPGGSPAGERTRRPAPQQPELPAAAPESSRTDKSRGRDPLEELLEDATGADQPDAKVDANTDEQSEFDEYGDEEEDDEDEDVVLDVTLSSLGKRGDRPQRQQQPEEQPPAPLPPSPPPQPPSGPIDLSGGPPPKRRQ